jgi:cytoskeleton protein RodZ
MSFETQDPTEIRHEPTIFLDGPRKKPNGKIDPAGEVGWFLQQERETRSLSIEEAGEATGIHPYHIEAIEFGDMTHMPPRLEALEMIAGYAQFLGFDAEPLVEHLIQFFPAPPVARKKFHPANPPVLSSAKILQFGKMPKIPNLNINLSKFPGGPGGIIASAFAVFMVFAGTSWMMSTPSQMAAEEQVAVQQTGDPMPTASTGAETADVQVVDTPLQAPVEAPVAEIANEPGAATASADDADSLGNFIQEQIPEPKAAKTKTAMKLASADVKQTEEGRVYGAANADARVILMAKAPVWLRIEDAGGNVVMTQMLNTGDQYRVPNRDGLIALSRDGGRLAYMIDGKEKGVLGPAGQILVGEKLDVVALESKI